MTVVVGAGMAGLIAAAMLRSECLAVVEAQDSLPDNHSAVLRFRSDAIGNILNIPFKKVEVVKSIHPWRNPIADALAYSRKTNGELTLRSIMTAKSDSSARHIAPPDFLDRLASSINCEIVFGKKIDAKYLEDRRASKIVIPLISTIPMPVLMSTLGWGMVESFRSSDATNISFDVEGLDAYCSLYLPDPSHKGSRVSVSGSRVIVECKGRLDPSEEALVVDSALWALGIGQGALNVASKYSRNAKILPYDEADRRKFILWATERHQIYSLGRYATWRPGLLLDDVVNDVRVIHRMINGGSKYSHIKQYS